MEFCLLLIPIQGAGSSQLAFAVIMIIVAVMDFVISAAAIFVFFKTRQTKSVTSKLIVIMNISNIASSIVAFPGLAIIFFDVPWSRSCSFRLTIQFNILVLGNFSFSMLLGVALDRYLRVTKLNRYNMYMNDFRMKVLVAAGATFSSSMAAFSVFFPYLFPLMITMNILNILVIFVALALYSMTRNKINIQPETLRRHLRKQSKEEEQNNKIRSTSKLIKTMLFSILVTYAPYNVISIISACYKIPSNSNSRLILDLVHISSVIPIFLSFSINTIIYCYGNSATRQYIEKLCKTRE